MRIAFLNLCHCDSDVVKRVADRLTAHPDFDMYIHVDAKADITPFKEKLSDNKQVHFVKNRHKVYWGGYNAILATMELIKEALKSARKYDYFILLQNLDYPIKSNEYIEQFFAKNPNIEYIRGCKIACTKDWHYARKYRLYNSRDKEYYLKKHSKLNRMFHNAINLVKSISTIGFNGIVKDSGDVLYMHYGAAQWAVTRECAEYFATFYDTHRKFNKKMMHVQFPDEEYFHTIVHSNDKFRLRCIKHDEPEKRWLVNWRNIHYFEFPKEVTVFEKKDYEKLITREELFIRKVKTGISDELMDMIDAATKTDTKDGDGLWKN